MYFKYSILALIFCLNCVWLPAQSWKKLKNEANEYFEQGKHKEALKRYFDIQTNRPQDMEVRLQMGICYYYTNNIPNAKKYLLYIVDNDKNAEDKAFYYLAKTY